MVLVFASAIRLPADRSRCALVKYIWQ